MRDFWATEAALGLDMLAYHLMSVFRQTVMRSQVQHTLSTLHGLVLAIGGSSDQGDKHHLLLSLPCRKHDGCSGLWSNVSHPPAISFAPPKKVAHGKYGLMATLPWSWPTRPARATGPRQAGRPCKP
jgi:hypothetical protein